MTDVRKTHVFLIGGSSTVRREGWTKHLRAMIEPDYVLVNLACGGSTSLMGIYRLLTSPETPVPGDIVVWAYASNEATACATKKRRSRLPIGVMLNDLKWLIKLCHDRDLRFLPLVLRTKRQCAIVEDQPYLKALTKLFAQAGIKSLTDRLIISDLVKSGLQLDNLFDDPWHLNINTPANQRLATDVAQALAETQPVKLSAAPWIEDWQKRNIVVFNQFKSIHTDFYESNLFSGPFHSIEGSPCAQVHGILRGCILIATDTGGGLSITSGRRTLGPFSTQINAEKLKRKKVLKQISIDAVCAQTQFFIKGELNFLRPQTNRNFVIQGGYVQNLNNTRDMSDGIVALLIETRPEFDRHPALQLLGRAKEALRRMLAGVR